MQTWVGGYEKDNGVKCSKQNVTRESKNEDLFSERLNREEFQHQLCCLFNLY